MADKKLDKKISKNVIRTTAELENYLNYKAKRHNYYKYYSKRKYIYSIINECRIFLSNGENWNDKLDSSGFQKDTDKINFGMCFSVSKSESIAMWLLYSGNDGAMINFDRNTINSIVESEKIEVGYFDSEKFVNLAELNQDQFEIILSDVIYYGDSKDGDTYTYYVKRSDEVQEAFPATILNGLRLFKKKCSWSYENECRIVVSINRDLLREKGVDINKCKEVKIEYNCENTDKLKQNSYDSPNAKQCIFQKSKMSDDLNWDLCKDCDTKESK